MQPIAADDAAAARVNARNRNRRSICRLTGRSSTGASRSCAAALRIRSSCRSTLSLIQCELELPTSFRKYQETSPMIEESGLDRPDRNRRYCVADAPSSRRVQILRLMELR